MFALKYNKNFLIMSSYLSYSSCIGSLKLYPCIEHYLSFIFIRLEDLEKRLVKGEVSLKGYCEQNWKVFEPYS
jgi:hypothetical protein